MYLTVTVDTEEDNWGEYNRASYSTENLRRIPSLQRIFDDRGVRPTYLISYPVATDPAAVGILSSIAEQGLCEIGSHPHPWNTPPIDEEKTPYNSYINHLPVRLQYQKLKTLHDTIVGNFGIVPTTCRSGRWGFSEDIARHLIALGYTVDTSISARLDWRRYQGPDFSAWSCEPFTYQVCDDDEAVSLLEVPATVEWVRSAREISLSPYRGVGSIPRSDWILSALSRLGLVDLVCMSPEIDTPERMIRLTETLQKRGAKVINVFFHSPSLLEGCSPFVTTTADLRAFLDRIDRFLAFAQSAGLRSVTMSELPKTGIGAANVKILPTHPGVS